MRALLALSIACACACTAIDDFGKFTIVDGGADAASPDLSPMTLGRLGDPCLEDSNCNYVNRICVHNLFNANAQDGYCTRACNTDVACQVLGSPAAHCVPPGGPGYCLIDCPPSTCRDGYDCCAMMMMTMPGSCAPMDSPVCRP